MSDANCTKDYDNCIKPCSLMKGEAMIECNDNCDEDKYDCMWECYKTMDASFAVPNANKTEILNVVDNCTGIIGKV